MLYGIGLTEEDLKKAQVGIVSMGYEGNTCNMHLMELSSKVKAGVQDAGLVGLRFNTIGVSDGISMGTEGMRYSLQSRDLIADSIETVMSAQWYDACIAIPGCDKNMPGSMMAIARVNRPSLMIYGGTIKSVSGEVSAAPSPNLAFALRVNRNVVDLPNGDFTADLATLRLTVAPSTKFVVNTLIQYNALDNDIGANVRLAYTFRPGSDLFLVYNERRGDPTSLWAPRDRAGLIKLTYLARF